MERSLRNSIRKPYFPLRTTGQLSDAHGTSSDGRRDCQGVTLDDLSRGLRSVSRGEENHQWETRGGLGSNFCDKKTIGGFLNFRLLSMYCFAF